MAKAYTAENARPRKDPQGQKNFVPFFGPRSTMLSAMREGRGERKIAGSP